LPKSAPKALHLAEGERQQLQQLVNRHSTAQQIAIRASIILLADAGRNHQEIGRELGISRDMARTWRERWLTLGEKEVEGVKRLEDAERSGAPATFSLEQILQLFALACEPPETYGRPISHWTARELAEEMVNQKIVERISPRHVGRLGSVLDMLLGSVEVPVGQVSRRFSNIFETLPKWTYKGKALAA